MFTSREVAVGIWTALFALWALIAVPEIKRSLWDVVRMLLDPRLLLPILFMSSPALIVGGVFHHLDLWSLELLKETIVWLFFAGLPMGMSLAASHTEESLLPHVLRQSIGGVMLVEFLVGNYTFPLPVELVLVPFVTIVIMLGTVAGRDSQYASVEKLMTGIQGVVGLVILIYVGRALYLDFPGFWTLGTALELLLVPLLSIVLVPFVYIMALYSIYQQLFIRLSLGPKKDPGVIRYAKFKFLRLLKFNRARIARFLKEYPLQIMRFRNKAEVDQLIAQEKQLAWSSHQRSSFS